MSIAYSVHMPIPLSRRLGTQDAVVIGLGSMIGAGVFAVFAPAAQAAGSSLLLGLALAAFVAFANATSSAQLAATYPSAGGTYVYGREQLGPWWGFAAGWSFLIGKTASCAAMALVCAAYLVPAAWQRPTAIAVVVALTAMTSRGITRTARLTRVTVTIALVSLAVVAAAAFSSPGATAATSQPWFSGGWMGVLQSAGLLFFAFAGYARIATLGEEVRDPSRVIPRAITIALALAVAVYAVVAAAVLFALGPADLAASRSPLVDAVARAGWAPLGIVVVQIGAAVASLGALLGLLAGVSRTALAMARNHDVPSFFAAVHPRFQVPVRAEWALAATVVVLVATLDVRGAIGFSSFGVLLYYGIANASAFTQPPGQRRFPRVLAAAGVVGCVVLVVTLPVTSVVWGVGVLTIGISYRAIRLRFDRKPPGDNLGP